VTVSEPAATEEEIAPATPPSGIPTVAWVLPRPRPDCYVGSFPLHFEQKLVRVVTELQAGYRAGTPRTLHPFGGLAEIGDRVDLNPTTTPTWVGDAHDLSFIPDETYDLTVLDPPYSDEEAEWLYSTPPLRPAVFTAEAVRVTRTGGHVAVYHRAQPKRPEGTRLVYRIVVLTRTGHAPRICFIFEKGPGP
jgi:hypothetical protein